MNWYIAALVVLTLRTFPSMGQLTEPPPEVIADKMEIPRYWPLAAQAGVSGEVNLRLQVKKDGEVTSIRVVSAQAEHGYGTSGFVYFATEAAKLSRFPCSKCEGPTFDHVVTYQFQYPPVPKRVCTDAAPPPPPSTVDSPGHVTVRPKGWSCVQP